MACLEEASVGSLVKACVGSVEVSCLDVVHDCQPPVPEMKTRAKADRSCGAACIVVPRFVMIETTSSTVGASMRALNKKGEARARRDVLKHHEKQRVLNRKGLAASCRGDDSPNAYL